MSKNLQKNIKVSIITVCFNSVKTLEQTIVSVLHQTYSNIEYIIIDGGSTDGTLDIIRKYENRLAFWCSEPDNGIYDAMNKGIGKATGEIIGIINSDDWYELYAVEKVADIFLKKQNLQVLHGGIRIYENDYYKVNYNPPTKDLTFTMLPHPSCFVAVDAYRKFGLYNTNYTIAADYDLLLRLYIKKVFFLKTSQLLVNVRLGGASFQHSELGEKEFGAIQQKYAVKYKRTFVKRIKSLFKSKK